jgi:ubiquitin carboxyl-terminal hydrolase 7
MTHLFYCLYVSRRILLFPKGNNQGEFVSVYLEVADPSEQGLADNWHVCAQFSLVISHPQDPTIYYSNS